MTLQHDHENDKTFFRVTDVDEPVLYGEEQFNEFKKILSNTDPTDDRNVADIASLVNEGRHAYVKEIMISSHSYYSDCFYEEQRLGREWYFLESLKEPSPVNWSVFILESKDGTTWDFNEEFPFGWYGEYEDTKIEKADIVGIEVDMDNANDEEYTEEFFESVYREARGVSIDDDGNGYYDSGVDWISPIEIKNGQFELPKWIEEPIRKSLQDYPDIDVSHFIKRLTDPNGLVNDYINIREEKASEESIKEAIKHYLQELVQLIEVAIAPSKKDSSQENDSLVCTLEKMATKYKIAIDDINKSLR